MSDQFGSYFELSKCSPLGNGLDPVSTNWGQGQCRAGPVVVDDEDMPTLAAQLSGPNA